MSDRISAAQLAARAALFVLGDFEMHSGAIGHWKIECDALTDEDIECLAFMLAERLPPFGFVAGVPTGGTRLAFAMRQYATEDDYPRLIVDDVLTTGASMEETRQTYERLHPVDAPSSLGAVIFARGKCPSWITPLFSIDAREAWEEAEAATRALTAAKIALVPAMRHSLGYCSGTARADGSIHYDPIQRDQWCFTCDALDQVEAARALVGSENRSFEVES